MNSNGTGIKIDTRDAVTWVRRSLSLGSSLSASMTSNLSRLPFALLLVPEGGDHGIHALDDYSRGIRLSDADRIAALLLSRLGAAGAKVLVVEDDLARRGDPGLHGEFAFIGDHVIRWTSVEPGGESACHLLRQGSSGYPLNAFLCRQSASELGLSAARDLGGSEQEKLEESICAVIVSVYDAEAYVVLSAYDPGS
jgi:hypothetical protein